LLTDFGTADGYVGAMKGVLLSICSDVHIVDLTHEILAGDVRAGAFALVTSAPLFPRGTIHVAVVDPGVGTARRALLVEAGGAFFVGPDNGIVSLAAPVPRTVWSLDRAEWFRQPTSTTFHGRDVFAPVAAHLAGGVAPERLGTRVDGMLELRVPTAERRGDDVSGEVVHVDRFGNVITSLHARDLRGTEPARVVEIGERRERIPLLATYGSAPAGTLLALVGSSGYVEIAVSSGSARDALGTAAKLGTPVRLISQGRAGEPARARN
jgi:S-adenosylmethionine hydrolase